MGGAVQHRVDIVQVLDDGLCATLPRRIMRLASWSRHLRLVCGRRRPNLTLSMLTRYGREA